MYQCPVCRFPCRDIERSALGGRYRVDCFRCGQYEIGDNAHGEIKATFSESQIANLSGYVRRNQGLLIIDVDLERLAGLQTPSPNEKAYDLLTALGKEFPKPGAVSRIDTQRLSTDLHLTSNVRVGEGEYSNDSFTDDAREASRWMAVASAETPDELRYLLIDFLASRGFIAEKRPGAFTIMPGGWQKIAEQRQSQSKSTKAFVAMSFVPELSQFFNEAMEPAVRAAGYEAVRVDRTEHNNRIDDEIIALIRQTRFLVADFTNNRAGVYYEAGFAKGLGREVIWCVREDHLADVHFDTRQYNFIRWNPSDLPEFVKALRNRIEATVGKGPLSIE